jgi:hypothetical protein
MARNPFYHLKITTHLHVPDNLTRNYILMETLQKIL